MFDSIRSSGQRRGECEIRIRIRSRCAAFDAERLTVADDAESCGAIVVAPRDAGRRERSGDVAFVRRRIWPIKREQLANVLHPAAEEPAECGGGLHGSE